MQFQPDHSILRELGLSESRNHRQGEFIRGHSPQWFKNEKTVVPPAVVDGVNLIWHSDLRVSGAAP